MTIKIAATDQEILACFPIMKVLRSHLVEKGEFLSRVRKQELDGYMLVYLVEDGVPLAVSGFRISQCLAWGAFMYIDDLVSHPDYRSQGHGANLLAWLERYAIKQNCSQLHLDSGLQRADAHRFYKREEMEITSFHFCKTLNTVDFNRKHTTLKKL